VGVYLLWPRGPDLEAKASSVEVTGNLDSFLGQEGGSHGRGPDKNNRERKCSPEKSTHQANNSIFCKLCVILNTFGFRISYIMLCACFC
jgi:hypothetical protein